MVINIVTVLLLATGIMSQSADSSLVQTSKEQADYYLAHISDKQEAPLHYWALSQLAKDKPALGNYIKRNIHNYNLAPAYAESFTDTGRFNKLHISLSTYQKRIAGAAFSVGSPLLMLDLLSSLDSTSKRKKLLKRYQETTNASYAPPFYSKTLLSRVAGAKQIGATHLPLSSIRFAHYILSSRNEELLSAEFMNRALKKWDPVVEHYQSKSDPSLSATVKKAAILHFAYEQRKMGTIVELYDCFFKNNYFPSTDLKLDLYKLQDVGSYRLGYYEKALTLHKRKSIPLSRYLEDKQSELFFLKHQGIFLYKIGNLKKSQQMYHRVLEKIKEYDLDLQTRKIDILNNLSLTYYKTGYYDTYLNYQSQALELAKKFNEYRYQLKIYRNLHIYHRLHQNWQDAQQYLDRAQQLASQHGQTRDLAAVYITTSTFYKEFKSDYEQAEKYLNKAQNLISANTYYNQYIKILSQRGKLYVEMGNYQKARQYFRKLSQVNKKKKDTRNYLNALIRLADLELTLQNYQRVDSLMAKIERYELNTIDFELLVKHKSIEAQLYHQEGQTDKAIKTIRPAIEQIIQRARQSSDIRAGYWHVEQEFIDVLKSGVDLLMADNRSYQAIKLLDRIKTINEAELYKSPLVKANKMSKKELTREQQINEQLNNLRKRYLNAKGEKKLALKNRINRLKAKRNQLYGKLTQIKASPDFSLQYIQHKLPYTHLMLHVTELKNTFYIGYISSNDISITRIPLNTQLRTLFDSAIDSLFQAETNLNKLYTIYTALQLNEIPDYIKRISLIPDSYLYQLPIEILPVEQPNHSYSYGSTRYLIENVEVSYYTSLAQFNTSDPDTRELPLDFVGFGLTDFKNVPKSLVPLPFADQEVKNIFNQLTQLESKKIFLNQNATEENFRATASKSKIIHLATHSTINNREPLFSSIFLHHEKNHQPDNKSEGRIFAYELFEMDLSNQLIMMNSCESGSGPYLQGSGVMGISRSLKYAGGNSLILNLWAVNDKYASEFATKLYQYLNKGVSKAEAMRRTKHYFLQNNNANPHYWGPYMLLGDPSPIVDQKISLLKYLTFGSLLFILLVGINIRFVKGKQSEMEP